MRRPDYDAIAKMLKRIEYQGVGLTDWEEEFTESMRKRLDDNKEFTQPMILNIERIYAERTP